MWNARCYRSRIMLCVCMPSILLAGCASVMNPYLDTSKSASKIPCMRTMTCSVTERFVGARDAVVAVQDSVRQSYTDRAHINSWTSALAFPLSGLLLYGGATRSSDGARKGILGWGLATAAGYEARNALLSNSPEGVYLLAEARLGCVVDEASKYDLRPPEEAVCTAKRAALLEHVGVVEGLAPSSDLRILRDAYVARAKGALTRYDQRDETISAAIDRMQAASRKIVSETNFQIKTASTTPGIATALLKSNMAIIQPGSKLDPNKAAPAGDALSYQKFAAALNTLVDQLDGFARQCVRAQPVSTAAFDSCTTYSPAVPPAPTLLTSLPANEFDMSPGASRTFTVTSTPSGTPWADFTGEATAAVAAMGRPQIVTLSPNQSQVTLHYTQAVKVDTDVVLSLTVLGSASEAQTVTIKLKAAPAGAPPPPVAAAPGAQTIAALKSHACLMSVLGLKAGDSDAQVKSALEQKFRNLGQGEPTDAAILEPAIHKKIIGKHTPKTPECAAS